MGYFICLFCVVFSQTVYAKVVPYSGQNAINVEHKLPFFNRNTLGGANGVLARQIARTGAIAGNILTTTETTNGNANIGNGNTANANLIIPSNANDNRASVILENVNPSAPKATNQANENLAASNFAENKATAAANKATNKITRINLQGNYPNLGYARLSNSNLINSNIRPDLGNQLYRSNYANPIAHSNIASPLYGNFANTYNAPNTFTPFTNSFNLANSNGGAGNFLPNFGNGNIANANHAHVLATGSLSNTITPGASFAIGGNPFTVLSGLSGSPQIGLNIVADALEVGGSVSVTGKMPFYGTVALTGSLPTDGTATVNYGCPTHHMF